MLLLTATLFVPSVHAQDYTQLWLPEGVKARIGKGDINDIRFSPDGNVVAVAGSIGIWLYNADVGCRNRAAQGASEGIDG